MVEPAAPLDSRRLANHRLAQALRAGGRQQDGTQSAFCLQSLEDLRQPATQSGSSSNHSSPFNRLVLHTYSDSVERNRRGPAVVAGPECFTRCIVPSATSRNEILARTARSAPARLAHSYFSDR